MLARFLDNLANGRTNAFSNAHLTLFGCMAYILLGGLGLLLAIGPGYASPIFPSSGLALALVLLFGGRALPAVWLGSAVMNMVIALLHGTLGTTSIALALLIACGATAQAWFGFWLVNLRLSSVWGNLERELDALIFLLLGGVLACLLSSSVGVCGLYALGFINRADIFYSWWNWYVGDTLGVLIFAPLALQLLNSSAGQWHNRQRYIFLSIFLMTSLLWLAFYGTTNLIRRDQEYRLKNDCEAFTKRISDRLLTHREVLTSLHNFIEVTPNLSFKQFEQFTKMTLKDHPDIFALSLNDLVLNSQRSDYELMISGLSPLGQFQITERDSQRNLIRANERAEYVAVRYIVPLSGNKPAVGFDINSEPIRRDAINRARASNTMATTSPIQLVQEQKKRVGILELMPVEELSLSDGGDQKKPHLLGFAVSVVKIDEMIEIATHGTIPNGLIFRVW